MERSATDRSGGGPLSFEDACARLEQVLASDIRSGLVRDLATASDLAQALRRLARGLRADRLESSARRLSLQEVVRVGEQGARQWGFHPRHDWDGPRAHFTDETIPLDVLSYVLEQRGHDPADRVTLAILLDYYLLYVLAALSLAIWDAGDPNAALDRLTSLLQLLQGPGGSGQRFVDDAETLLLVATSHYEPEEGGYGALLERVSDLDAPHRLRLALVHAASLGCHLRFGFEVTYGRDTLAMRQDNTADYPWLCFAVATLVEEYAQQRRAPAAASNGERIVEALLNGLSPDARAFVGEPPPCLAARADWAICRDRLQACRQELLAAFDTLVPSAEGYSPLALFCNFAQNVLKGTVVDALLRGHPWTVSLNDLFAGAAPGTPAAEKRRELALRLTAHARAHPDLIRGEWRPVIVYDPQAGRRAVRLALSKLRT